MRLTFHLYVNLLLFYNHLFLIGAEEKFSNCFTNLFNRSQILYFINIIFYSICYPYLLVPDVINQDNRGEEPQEPGTAWKLSRNHRAIRRISRKRREK